MSDLIERQAVLNILDDMVKDCIKENDFDKAQGVAWVKVQKLPSVSTGKPNRCGDAISRTDAIRVASGYCHWSNIPKELEKLPSVSTEKTGRWIEQEGYDGDTYYDCSECGESFCLIDGTPTDNLYNYCPNCGAKMEVEE